MGRVLLFGLGGVLVMTPGAVRGQAADRPAVARIAVVDTGNAGAFCDLLEAEFSQWPEVELLERRDLAAIGAEAKLGKLMSSSGIARIGGMLGADGMVLVSEDEDARMAHLVAVAPGARLASEFRRPKADDLGEDAGAVATALAPHVETLRAIVREEAVPVSLLGVSFSMGEVDVLPLERQLNTLLARRLARRPGVLVLERWDLARLRWDHSLDAEASPFWTGSRLLDAEVTRKDERWHARIRLREGPSSDGAILEVSAPAGEVAELGRRIAETTAEALRVDETPMAWDPLEEANQFARLGQWAYANATPTMSIAALETAFTLGYSELQGAKLLMDSYRLLLNQRNLSVRERLAFCIRGNQTYRDFLSEIYRYSRGSKKGKKDESGVLTAQNIANAYQFWPETIKVLKAAYETGLGTTQARDVALLRSLYRTNHRTYRYANYEVEPKNQTLGSINNIPFWTDTPEEALIEYRNSFSAPRSVGPGFSHNPPEWLISWDGRDDKDRLDELWHGFVDELLGSENLGLRANGLVLHFKRLSSDKRRAFLPEIARFLHKHREAIAEWDRKPYPNGFVNIMRYYAEQLDDRSHALFFEYAKYLVSYSPPLSERIALTKRLLSGITTGWTRSQAAELYAIAQKQYRRLEEKREAGLGYPDKWRANSRIAILNIFMRQLLQHFPDLEQAEDTGGEDTAENALPVELSYVIRQTDPKEDDSYHILKSVQIFDDTLWLNMGYLNKRQRIILLDPKTGHAAPLSLDGRTVFDDMRFTLGENTLWVITDGELWSRPRKGGNWSVIDLPNYKYGDMTEINGTVYAICREEGLGEGVLQIDPQTGTTDLILSSRRRQARNNLDGTRFGSPTALFPSGTNRLCMLTDHWLFERQDDGKTWQRQFAEQFYSSYYRLNTFRKIHLRYCIEDDRGIYLTRGGRGLQRILWYPPDTDSPEFLLKDPRHLENIADARWEINWWNPPFIIASTTTDGTNLWGIGHHGDGADRESGLIRFRKGKPDPEYIPIAPAVPAELEARVKLRLKHRLNSWNDSYKRQETRLKTEYKENSMQLNKALDRLEMNRARRLKKVRSSPIVRLKHIVVLDGRILLLDNYAWGLWTLPIEKIPDSTRKLP
ncbi:MAG: hypothetical protein ACOCUY_00690 [Verrucomicrobiota bacterium]